FAYGASLREGDSVFFDVGCYGVGGYASDAARTVFVGEPATQVQSAYGHLEEALKIGEHLAQPGAKCSEVHEEINRYLDSQGLAVSPYGIGHGIGLRICEPPAIHRMDRMDQDAELYEGETIALEPETAVEIGSEVIVLKIEENYVIESG